VDAVSSAAVNSAAVNSAAVNSAAATPAGDTQEPASGELAGPAPDGDTADPVLELVDALWEAFRSQPGDDTRNALVEHYQPLIKQIVRRFGARLPRTVDRGDLLTAANVGLINAVRGFDPERGVRFESYCELRVKGALLDELRSQDWLPRPWRQKIEQQKRTVEQLRRDFGRNPSDSEVAAAMGFDLDVYQQTFGVGLPGTPSGSMPADEGGEDGAVASPLDIVQDQAVDAPGERLSRDELMKLVSQRMTDQERRIVYLKYWEELPMREIGDLTGLSESRVCKIHTRLIERLQDRFRAHEADTLV